MLRVAFVLRSTEITPGSFGLFQFILEMPAGYCTWHVRVIVINSNCGRIPRGSASVREPPGAVPYFRKMCTPRGGVSAGADGPNHYYSNTHGAPCRHLGAYQLPQAHRILISNVAQIMALL